uniref:Cardiolipin synthase N-terminal domain-containing protein n=1 Tax=Rhizophora mucronata TaxID=61149 RepID=A0A2P2MLU1_RHIMU
MLANSSLVSCNYASSLAFHSPGPRFPIQTQTSNPKFSPLLLKASFTSLKATRFPFPKKGDLQVSCHGVLNDSEKDEVLEGEANGKEGRDWTTSILLLAFWVAVLYYVFFLTPNQTPSRDMYFLQKLLNLKGDDGFLMNEVLVSLWYIKGLWPLVYSMLLLPTGRSSKGKIPVWPFLVLSCFGGAYALLPYFVLWRPPPPPVEENELGKWPLNFLESKFTAWVSLAAGLGIVLHACLANGDVWNEFYQYFRESKFIHVTCLDFSLLSAFAPFWVYNDMTSRKWYEKGSWLLPISLVPFLGPSLYLVLRPSLSELPASTVSNLIRTEVLDRKAKTDDVENK